MKLLYQSLCYISCFSIVLTLGGCGSVKKTENRPPLVEKADDVTFVQYQATLFDSLDLSDKIFAYHLSRAILAGDPITYKQIHRHGYRIKLILDGVVGYSEGMREPVIQAINEYTKLFWANSGFYKRNSGEKFLPSFDRRLLQEAVMIALSNGAQIGFRAHKSIRFQMDELEPFLFKKDLEPEMVIDAGIYRAGNDTLPPGLCSEELSTLIDNLRLAQDYTNEAGQIAGENLAIFFETGNLEYYGKFLSELAKSDRKVEGIAGYRSSDFVSLQRKNLYYGIVYLWDDVEGENLNRIRNLVLASGLSSIIPFRTDDPGRVLTAGEVLTTAGILNYGTPSLLIIENPLDGSISKVLYFSNVQRAEGEARGLNSTEFAAEKLLTQLKAVIVAEIASSARNGVCELASLWLLETAFDAPNAIATQEVIAICKTRLLEAFAQFNLDSLSDDKIVSLMREAQGIKIRSQYASASYAGLTPILNLRTTKMGKIKEVSIDYPFDILKYGLYVAEASRVVSESEPNITKQ